MKENRVVELMCRILDGSLTCSTILDIHVGN